MNIEILIEDRPDYDRALETAVKQYKRDTGKEDLYDVHFDLDCASLYEGNGRKEFTYHFRVKKS